jgi:hypothetical protein
MAMAMMMNFCARCSRNWISGSYLFALRTPSRERRELRSPGF